VRRVGLMRFTGRVGLVGLVKLLDDKVKERKLDNLKLWRLCRVRCQQNCLKHQTVAEQHFP
jgi:hypothetical protein